MSERKLSSLAPGDALDGRVASIELAGAFIDVGAERRGFVHISNIRPQKINRIEEVLQIGQTVSVWVRKVDPNANRLELTMLRPVELELSKIVPGMKVSGKVTRIEGFGAFVDIGAERNGLVHVSEMGLDYVKDPRQEVALGDEIEAIVLEVDQTKKQIRLSMKAAQLEPELDEAEEEEEELPTAMEVALRQALEGSGDEQAEAPASEATSGKNQRSDQEDLLSRTLSERVKTSTSERDE